jgi:hypothetical protein
VWRRAGLNGERKVAENETANRERRDALHAQRRGSPSEYQQSERQRRPPAHLAWLQRNQQPCRQQRRPERQATAAAQGGAHALEPFDSERCNTE